MISLAFSLCFLGLSCPSNNNNIKVMRILSYSSWDIYKRKKIKNSKSTWLTHQRTPNWKFGSPFLPSHWALESICLSVSVYIVRMAVWLLAVLSAAWFICSSTTPPPAYFPFPHNKVHNFSNTLELERDPLDSIGFSPSCSSYFFPLHTLQNFLCFYVPFLLIPCCPVQRIHIYLIFSLWILLTESMLTCARALAYSGH